AFSQNPEAVAAYIETPVNPTMAVVDIARISEIAHRYGAWVIADNTFATPFCQRPLTLGADVVVHSTTKYISGHGLTIGGAVVSRHVNFINNELNGMLKMLGGVCSPMDAWLANNGLKTFELRMQRHCDNGLQIARYLEQHPAVEHVYYPGLPGHPDHELAKRQMLAFGGMLSFELKGGLRAGEDLMNRIKVMTLAVSLGNVDTLIQHPATMSHSNVPRDVRIKAGLSDGLVRLSVGIENCEDLIADFEQAFGN
ncbi:MAG: methionine gamma-lyase, partial [Anaerolineaceae bacterium]|nr:methionine gamma-lyase [Anaerolineaceae bacterium]